MNHPITLILVSGNIEATNYDCPRSVDTSGTTADYFFRTASNISTIQHYYKSHFYHSLHPIFLSISFSSISTLLSS